MFRLAKKGKKNNHRSKDNKTALGSFHWNRFGNGTIRHYQPAEKRKTAATLSWKRIWIAIDELPCHSILPMGWASSQPTSRKQKSNASSTIAARVIGYISSTIKDKKEKSPSKITTKKKLIIRQQPFARWQMEGMTPPTPPLPYIYLDVEK